MKLYLCVVSIEQTILYFTIDVLTLSLCCCKDPNQILSYCRQFTYKINDYLAGRRSENLKNPWNLKTKLPLFWGVGQTHTQSGMHSINYDGDNQSNPQYESTIVRKSRRLRRTHSTKVRKYNGTKVRKSLRQKEFRRENP